MKKYYVSNMVLTATTFRRLLSVTLPTFRGVTTTRLVTKRGYSLACPVYQEDVTLLDVQKRNKDNRISDPKNSPVPSYVPCWIQRLPTIDIYEGAIADSLPLKSSVDVQYLSDVHIDTNDIPKITRCANILALCGDIGNPNHKNFEKFLRGVSEQFETVLFVPGNHDYDCGSLYEEMKVNANKPIMIDIVNKFNNIILLDNSKCVLKNGTIVLGSTMWPSPILRYQSDYNDTKIIVHTKKYLEDSTWIQNNLKYHENDNVLVLTHVPPTQKLIEPKYLSKGVFVTSWFANNFDHIIGSPVVAWLSGHTHSIIQQKINGVVCGINAYGYSNKSDHAVTRVVSV
jgi:predicted phosphohydrolase